MSNAKYRIAAGALMTECNHLGGQPTTLERFELYDLHHGDEVLDAQSGALAGMLDILRENQAEIAPLIEATTCPGAPLTAECYSYLKNELISHLQQSLPVDGVLLSLHGSASAENAGDVEGDLLATIREIVGNDVPIVATLDPHGHVTQAMVESADALLAFETYPHIDTEHTGIRAAKLLLRLLDENIKPAMVMAKVPVLVSGVNGTTDGPGPFADVMRTARAMEDGSEILTTSVFLVHPYLDLPGMGGGGLVVTGGDASLAEKCAREITNQYWEKRFDLEPETCSPCEAIVKGAQIIGGPVLLVECADCCGGGAAGDSVHSLRALMDAEVKNLSLVPVVDPQAAAACHAAGAGATVQLELGHKLDPKWGKPLTVSGKVLRLSDGEFSYSGGNWAGTEGHLGPSAVLQIGAIEVLITTNATYDWADEQFAAMGINTSEAKYVVVKNPMNYRIGYQGIAAAAYILDTPGPTPATLRGVNYQNVSRPYFPADQDIADLQPQILKRRN